MPSVKLPYNSDQKLVDDLSSDSRTTFNKLYNKYAPLLLGFMVKMLKDEKLAEKILQQAFIEIWNSRHTYNAHNEHLFTWMFRITKASALKNDITDTIQKPVGFVNMSENLNEKNDEAHNLVFELIYFNHYSIKEAAELLNMNEDRVMKMLRNAIIKHKTLSR